jgi:hypothetical protein
LVQLYFAKIILFPVILNKTGKILKNAGKFGNYTSFITKPGKSWLMLKDSGYNYLSCNFANKKDNGKRADSSNIRKCI